ncbi:MAG: 3-dehydroquinate synthase [Candidatus Latescibacterota bacterium]|jgi:3-dehydroquinate synthase
MPTIQVDLAERSYAVHVDHGVLDRLGPRCRELALGDQVAVVADEAVAVHYLQPVTASLIAAGFRPVTIPFSGGDPAKSLATAEAVLGAMIEAELDRRSWVLALGGGVVGDLAGFAAAVYLRGIPFVQVPTTVVAQVDASVGGKTAVNHRLGKNLVGAFHQPRLVLIDTGVLRTLPRRELISGMAEVVKHAVILDPELFAFLETHLEAVLDQRLDPELLDWMIARNVQLKARIVEEDERESGSRALLNYGHTVGHAIEAATRYERYRHGEAVILGMLAAGQLGVLRGTWSEVERQRQDDLLARLGIPAGLAEVEREAVVERTRSDKKRVAGRLRFVLCRRIGAAEVVDGVPEDEVRAAVAWVQERHGR